MTKLKGRPRGDAFAPDPQAPRSTAPLSLSTVPPSANPPATAPTPTPSSPQPQSRQLPATTGLRQDIRRFPSQWEGVDLEREDQRDQSSATAVPTTVNGLGTVDVAEVAAATLRGRKKAPRAPRGKKTPLATPSESAPSATPAPTPSQGASSATEQVTGQRTRSGRVTKPTAKARAASN